MHEVSLMEQTLEIALLHARSEKATKIHRLKMRIGGLSGVIPDALQFAFDVVIQGSIAQDAQLEIEYIPVKCYCINCQQEFLVEDIFYECPQCGKLSTDIRQGKELELTSLELS